MSQFSKKLEVLKNRGQYRSLKLPTGIDLSSNDYLGLRDHPELKVCALQALQDGLSMGSGGSRLLRGHLGEHANLEEFAANYFNFEKSLFFANGFLANYALFTTLPDRRDTILFDSLIHASVRDGIQASNAKHTRILHNDLGAYEDALKTAEGQVWIAVEAVYSMDGDFAPLRELYDLAKTYNAVLIVDEAHSSGIFGEDGKGLARDLPRNNLITLHTCGKAYGVAGGLICASAETVDYMINKARPFIYSTAPPPLQALLVQKALALASKDHKKREHLLSLIKRTQTLFPDYATGSQIIPIIIGDDEKAVEMAQKLQAEGFDVRAIRPPTVAKGTARLRVSLNAGLGEQILKDFASTLQRFI